MGEGEADRERRIEQPFDRPVDDVGALSARLTSPLRPSSGIQEIIRITFEVQNGIVQTRNRTICMVTVRT